MSLGNLVKYKAKYKELLLQELWVTPCCEVLLKSKSILLFTEQFLKQYCDSLLTEDRVLEKWYYLLLILKGLKYSC